MSGRIIGENWQSPEWRPRRREDRRPGFNIAVESQNRIFAIQCDDSVRLEFNDNVDLNGFAKLDAIPGIRALVIRYSDDEQGTLSVTSDDGPWKMVGSRSQLSNGTFTWVDGRTLLISPPSSQWPVGKYVRFDLNSNVTSEAGNRLRASGGSVVAYVTDRRSSPVPRFHLQCKTDRRVLVDERSAQLLIRLTASNIDPQTHYLDDVCVWIDRSQLAANVSIGGAAPANESRMYPLGPNKSMKGDGDSLVFPVQIKTGLFYHLQQPLADGEIVPLTPDQLYRFPSAESGQIQLRALVRCVVREVGGPEYQQFFVDPVSFEIAPD